MMMINKCRLFVYLVLLACGACNTVKYLPQNAKYYEGGEIKISTKGKRDIPSELRSEIEKINRPKPNTKVFGLRIGLWAYERVQSGKAGILAKQINKRFGEKPVYLEDVALQGTKKLIRNRFAVFGYFDPLIKSTLKDSRHKASYTFEIQAGKRLLVDSLYAAISDKKTHDSVNVYLKSFIEEYADEHVPFPFSNEKLRQIRNKFTQNLLDKGFFYFKSDYIQYKIDSSSSNTKQGRAIVGMEIKNDCLANALKRFRLNQLKVYPNNKPLEKDYLMDVDTINYAGVDFIQKDNFYLPHRMYPNLFLKEGDLISSNREKNTRRRLNSIELFKYINIRYSNAQTNDSLENYLDASVFLTPYPKRSIGTEFELVSKSNNFVGPALRAEYLNRNLFRGGENLKLSAKIGYELQLIGQEFSGLNSLEAGLSADLNFPRVLIPFGLGSFVKHAVPSTNLKLSYELLRRSSWFQLNSFLTSLSYRWKPNSLVTHSITPLSINYLGISNETLQFDSLRENSFAVRNTLREQFILGGSYSFEYNQLSAVKKSNRFYVLFSADFSGNTVAAFQTLFNGSESENRIFGQNFAQYSRLNFDVRNYQKMGSQGTFVSRVFLGLGLPYGNSSTLPYAKQYSAGGPNSIRAFRIRSLGPGNFRPSGGGADLNQFNFFDRTGDIKIEGNLEYRFPIHSIFKGAVFTDVGNIWLRNEEVDEGAFSVNWYEQLAIGSGLGLRVDLDFFVIRLDVASPVRKPSENGFTWQESFRPFNSEWRSDNLIWNFGLGYPF